MLDALFVLVTVAFCVAALAGAKQHNANKAAASAFFAALVTIVVPTA